MTNSKPGTSPKGAGSAAEGTACCRESRPASSSRRDLRDPTELGGKLLDIASLQGRPKDMSLSTIADLAVLHVHDYVSPENPHDRYGDPRLIPCTLPN